MSKTFQDLHEHQVGWMSHKLNAQDARLHGALELAMCGIIPFEFARSAIEEACDYSMRHSEWHCDTVFVHQDGSLFALA